MNREIKKNNLTCWRLRCLEIGYLSYKIGYLFYKIVKNFTSQFGVVVWIYFIYPKIGSFVIKLSALLDNIFLFFSLDQWLSNLSMHQNYLGGLLKSKLPSEILILSVGPGWALKSHF